MMPMRHHRRTNSGVLPVSFAIWSIESTLLLMFGPPVE
jgi:hypothetical protein